MEHTASLRAAPDEHQNELTIERLAADSGMSVRNIRAHQSRGLLPPPEVRARTGYYGKDHVSRLRLIQEMQADGFNLRAIEQLLSGAEGSGEEILGFKRTLMAPFENEQPEIVSTADLVGGAQEPFDPKQVARAQKLGLIRPLGDDRWEIASPTLFRAREELAALGHPLERMLDIVEEMQRASESIARSFTRIFLDGVWKPFAEAGMPEDEWPRIRESLERLRPLASQALLATFEPVMTLTTEKAFDRELERSRTKRRPRKPGRKS